MMHLSKFFKTPILSSKFFFLIFIVVGLQSFFRLPCFLRFYCYNFLVNLFFSMTFKVQFPVIRRYVYVLRPKADNSIDVFGEEATN